MPTSYQRLKDRYKKLGLFGYLYFFIRWRLASFGKLEALVPKEGKILDFGCGSGILANFLALNSNQREIVGMDIWDEKIKQARRVSQEIENISFVSQEIEDIEGKFNVIVMQDVLHHLPKDEQKQTLLRLKNSLAENGMLIIQDIDKKSFPKYLIGWFVDALFCGYKNISYRSRDEIVEMLKDLGFRVKTTGEDKIAHIIFIASLS